MSLCYALLIDAPDLESSVNDKTRVITENTIFLDARGHFNVSRCLVCRDRITRMTNVIKSPLNRSE